MKQDIQAGTWLLNHLVLLLYIYVYFFPVLLFAKVTELTWFFFRGGGEGLERRGWEGEYFYLLREYKQILSGSIFHWRHRQAAPRVLVCKHSPCLLLWPWQIMWRKMRSLTPKSVSFSAQLTQSGLSIQKKDGISLGLSFFAAQCSQLWVSTEVK